MTKCFHCDKEVELLDEKLIPIDRPYVNIIVHRDVCFKEIQGYGEHKYLLENIEKIYRYAEERKKENSGGKNVTRNH